MAKNWDDYLKWVNEDLEEYYKNLNQLESEISRSISNSNSKKQEDNHSQYWGSRRCPYCKGPCIWKDDGDPDWFNH